ncbi:MAG: PTS transporter subunit EIIC [Streptococcaceae bacterium]|jgi:PTS system beta-glucosides-specific IIC component|nr:PTS transporter subunit EIIC [Streptococcaceae bacterium]
MLDRQMIAKMLIDSVGGTDNINRVVCLEKHNLIEIYLNESIDISLRTMRDISETIEKIIVKKDRLLIFFKRDIRMVYDEIDLYMKSRPTLTRPKETKGFEKIQCFFLDLIENMSGTMMPVIPMLAMCGIFGFFMQFIAELPNTPISTNSQFFIIWNAGCTAIFYFIPLVIANFAARQIGAKPIVLITIAAFLVYPDMIKLSDGPIQFFAFNIPSLNYSYTIFPIIVAAFLAKYLGSWLEKRLPSAGSQFSVPFLTACLVGLFIIYVGGPLLGGFAALLYNFFNLLLQLNTFLGRFVIGAAYQILVIFGLHWMITPMVTQHANEAIPIIWMSCIPFALVAQGAGGITCYLRTSNKAIKAAALSGILSSIAGITEPVLFGVNLRYGRIFLVSCIGGGIGALVAGLLGVKYYMPEGMLLGGAPFEVGAPDNLRNTLMFVLAIIICLGITIALNWFLSFKNVDKEFGLLEN